MAKINEQDIDALRDRAAIVDVVSGYVQLKKAGGHTFKGLCPFHSEKTPSFTVDAAKGLFYCFGCGVGGDVFKFVQDLEHLSFPEAVEWLAHKAGFQLRYEEMRPGEQKVAGLKLRLIAAGNESAGFFHDALVRSPEALPARRYLSGRGFGPEVAARWQLGYAPGSDSLCKHLMGKGFTQEELVQAGLARPSERDGRLYDAFRGRIMFPTWNLQGEVVGFGARALGDAQPKYLNTQETPVFQKSRLMYGLDRAKSTIARGAALVVEGYTDVIALHEAGITEAVATNGVALGEAHFALLQKFTHRAVLMFDADEAGKGATERGFELQHKLGLEVLVAPLPVGRDPAEVVAEDGPEAVRKIIDSGRPLMEFKLEQAIAKLPLDTPEAKARAVRAASEVLGWHPDPVARHEYAFMAARLIGVDSEVVQRALSERRSPPEDPGGMGGRDRAGHFSGHIKLEREVLQFLLVYSREARNYIDRITERYFTSQARRELFRFAQRAAGSDDFRVDARSAGSLSPDAMGLLTELTVGAESPPSDEDPDHILREKILRLQEFALERDIRARKATLQEVNPLDDPHKHDELFTQLVGLEAERRELQRELDGAS